MNYFFGWRPRVKLVPFEHIQLVVGPWVKSNYWEGNIVVINSSSLQWLDDGPQRSKAKEMFAIEIRKE